MHICFFSSEVFPFAKTGGLADVSAALPKALTDLGEHVTIFMPRYRCVELADKEIVRLSECAVRKKLTNLLDIIFIEHEGYFNRDGLYGNNSEDHPDNLERFNYFCIQCLELIKSEHLKVDIVHCHDWQTALIPVYLKTKYSNDSVFAQTKSILTIHNLAFQGLFSNEEFNCLESKVELEQGSDFEYFDQISLLKAGVLASDLVSTVSPQYALEILESELGFGFDPVFASRSDKVHGILNGLDQDIWNPSD
ncbi:Glycogen synthase, ADP-glucose transglucosylase, partial [hydrothermal vent metagenome]